MAAFYYVLTSGYESTFPITTLGFVSDNGC
jgi:hypothetical protein